MGARSKKANKYRNSADFNVPRLKSALLPQQDGRTALTAWSLDEIFAARQEQMQGLFLRPARMAEQMRTDDALAVAYENRLAPQRCVPTRIVPAANGRGASIAAEADALFGPRGVGIHADTRSDIHACLVDHGVAFGYVTATPREDGSRIDSELKYWPIEFVRWDPVFRLFRARANPETVSPADLPDTIDGRSLGAVSSYWLPIIHGDGRWVVFQKHDDLPFRKEAALLPAAVVWARHAFACRDWSKGSVAHGNAKVVGELPQGIALQDGNGALTPEAAAFLTLLQAIASADSPAGIRPNGSKTDFLVNGSSAWQVWSELVANAEKAAARIYLGTDGTLGTQGGAPGVDISALFGVASTKVRGDLECIERGINTGVIEPWTAINFGDSSLAPRLEYVIPNENEDAVKDTAAKRATSYFAALKTAHDAGIALTPEYMCELAEDLGVRAPVLSAPPVVAPPKAAADPNTGETLPNPSAAPAS